MEYDPVSKVAAALPKSEVVRATVSVREDGGLALAIGAIPPRSLFREEIARLEAQGNTCEDWSRVRVADGFDWRRVRDCDFHGDVVLGRFAASREVGEGVELPVGVYRSTLANCIIGNDALIQEVKLLAHQVVGERAIVFDCGRIICQGKTTFGIGLKLPLAIETGGRQVPAHAEIDVALAEAVAMRRGDAEFLRRHAQAVADYTSQVVSVKGIIEHDAVVRHTPQVRNCYVGPYALVDGATLLDESTLLSNAKESTQVLSGACVTGSILQWGCRVSSLAVVERSVLTEHSYAERHGKVLGSLLGPGTGVAQGEVSASLVGPLVGFHHQALLIAALWPEGKGNVSHGANVGSNHTSRAPDQEFWPGEGAFFGLGVNIKYPSDFSQSPYTLIATGTSTLPQKLAFPFSLVTPPSALHGDMPPAFNEILPGWMLSDNLYSLKRSEKKFRERYPGRRMPLECEIFRSDIIDMMRSAAKRLEAVALVKDIYTDKDIDGLGKNYLLEPSRVRAIAAYRFHIQLYALLGLKDRVHELLNQNGEFSLDHLLVLPTTQAKWEHQRRILLDEIRPADALAALRLLPGMLEKCAGDVEQARQKDDDRGCRIIDDYADVHVPAAEDPLVRQVWQEARRIQEDTHRFIVRLGEVSRAQPRVG